jgi:F-type H+-transporting ATPase subunit a
MHEINLAAEPIARIGSFFLTNSALTSVIVTILLIGGFILLGSKIALIPKGIYNAIEGILEYLYNTFAEVLESRKLAREFFPLLATLFIFIVINNWFGLVPGVGSVTINHYPLLRGGNADLNTTMALAIVSLIMTAYYGLKYTGMDYVKKFFNFKNPIFTFVGLLELISESAKLVSFSFRLFGNIFAGEVLIVIIAFLIPLIIPLPFFALEIFVGFIQAVVFMMLTLVFLKISTAKNH